VPAIPSIRLSLKALQELGPKQVGLYLAHQLAVRSGYLRWKTPAEPLSTHRDPWIKAEKESGQIRRWLPLPRREDLVGVIETGGLKSALAEADEIVSGQVRLFGGAPVPLNLRIPGTLKHWTAYEKAQIQGGKQDIKWLWEAGRFGWAYILGRAYHLSGEERYAQSFWDYTEIFLEANPVNMGPHWASAQEVALRLIALVFASQIFLNSDHTTPARLARLSDSIATHARRIPPTLAYARAQNNNHLLSEAAGLLTAGCALPEHPQASRWERIGCRWLDYGFRTQIDTGGAYAQNSTNYHRLMLQIALWTCLVSRATSIDLDGQTRQRLTAATRWLLAMVDPVSGQVPNLGPNDGAYIMPLSSCPFHDYRPVLQAAGLAFLGEPAFRPGPWDEMSLWFDIDTQVPSSSKPQEEAAYTLSPPTTTPLILRTKHSWGYLRAASFTSRPGHADQLHLDLWWHGLNIAQDAGTYLYNAPPPWDNSLSRTQVHNTITIEGQDQMTRAGLFLWLDWAQGEVLEQNQNVNAARKGIAAQHNGYHRFGVLHQRAAECREDHWVITDNLVPSTKPKSAFSLRNSLHKIRLHWLLPDWPWDIDNIPDKKRTKMRLESPFGRITLRVQFHPESTQAGSTPAHKACLIRAGELVYGTGTVSPVLGWVSRNYGYKEPALSFSVETESRLPLTVITEWDFP
jgi:hypothetical protein